MNLGLGKCEAGNRLINRRLILNLENGDYSFIFVVKNRSVKENSPQNLILNVKGLAYSYGGKAISFPDFSCSTGKHLLISGNSGVGKTTLLHLLSGLLKIQEGSVQIKGDELSNKTQSQLDQFRGKKVGIVFQQPRFIRSLNVLENITAAQFFGLQKVDKDDALKLLFELGLAEKVKSKTQNLSGGERQRLAIARALCCNPEIVYADEPTSSLDDTNAEMVYQLLVSNAELNNATLVVVSHDQRLKSKFKNQVTL